MTLNVTVKNTFLTIDDVVSARVRSSSVPRSFKSGDYCKCCDSPRDSPRNDDSTDASSDKDRQATYSDSEFGEEFQDCRLTPEEIVQEFQEMPTADEKSRATVAPRLTLSLSDMVSTEAKERCKLRTTAQPFKSVRTAPAEVTALIANAVAVLSSGMDIVDVQVNDGGMGGTCMIIGESSSTDPDVSWTFTLVKDALLNLAEQSENTYILGYDAQPFNNLDPLSFSANIGCVPAAHCNTACWDTYSQGFCPRCTTCRWDHPSKFDMMRLIVMIKKQTSSTWLD